MARMWKTRKAYRERKQFFKDHVSVLYLEFLCVKFLVVLCRKQR